MDLFDVDDSQVIRASKPTQVESAREPGLGEDNGAEDNSGQKGDAFADSRSDDGASIDLDKEVRVKVRKPRAKLDDERLLSDRGLPRLKKDAPRKFKFRGKGHELWAHELFPKANFMDALTMIEKTGHKTRVKLARKQWIDEARFPKNDNDDPDDIANLDDLADFEDYQDRPSEPPSKDVIPENSTSSHNEDSQRANADTHQKEGLFVPDDEDDLIAEYDKGVSQPVEDNYQDEMDVMAAMEDTEW